MRTREQIIADCEKRYEELQQQAGLQKAKDEERARQKTFACRLCRYGSGLGNYQKCREPLVVGFDPRGYAWAWDCKDGTNYDSKLCGPEKALWRPKPTLCQRIIEAIERFFA